MSAKIFEGEHDDREVVMGLAGHREAEYALDAGGTLLVYVLGAAVDGHLPGPADHLLRGEHVEDSVAL